MGAIDHLDGRREMADLVRRIERLERSAPGGFTAVSRGRTRFVGNESLLVEGSQKVAGWLVVTGTLRVVGTFLLDGITTITGALTATGRSKFNGPVEVTETLDVSAETTLRGATTIRNTLDVEAETKLLGPLELRADMTVTNEGKISVGNMKIGEGTHGSGKGVSFTNGGALSANGDGIEIYAATKGILSITPARSQLSNGASQVTLDSLGVKLGGLQTRTGVTPNIYIDGNGQLWRVI